MLRQLRQKKKGESLLIEWLYSESISMSVDLSKGNFIRTVRMENGVRAVKICREVSISEASLYAMEVGTRGITPNMVEEMIQSVGINEKYKKFLLYPRDILEKDRLSTGELIRLKRLESGVNMTCLAEKLGVSVSILSCIEKGIRRVSKKMYPLLAKAIGMDNVSYDLFNSNEMTAKIIYRMSDEYEGVPVIDGIYLLDKEFEKRLKSLKRQSKDWKVKECAIYSSIENYKRSLDKKSS